MQPALLLLVASAMVAADGRPPRVYDTVRGDSIAAGDTVPTTVSWVGDVLLAWSVGELAEEQGTRFLLAAVDSLLQDDDYSVANLECVASTGGTPQVKRFTFRAHPNMLPGLRSSGIDAVSLANNHSLDYGRAALLRMIDSLRSAGIAFAGAGANLDSAARPIVARLRTCTLAVVCFSRLATGDQFAGTGRPGVATAYNPARLVAEIERARLSTGVVAVFLHWGRERSTMPMPVQRELARRCIDAGAVLVVGCHPHVLQGFEFYRGGLIAYSLGNFVFTNRDRRPTMILQTRFRGRELVSARIIPCRISDLRPEPVADVAALQAEFRRLSGLSVGARVDEAGFVGRE